MKRHPADRMPYQLADTFCRHSRRKIENLFAAIRSNDDPETYQLARGVLDGQFAWMEKGIVEIPGAPSTAPGREAPQREALAGR
jgi:hypothetical protein